MLNYTTSKSILESHKLDLYVTYISQKTNSKPRSYKEGYKLSCPAHDDRRSSFVISQKSDGTILVKCFAGCSTQDICNAMNITMKDLFPMKPQGYRHGK